MMKTKAIRLTVIGMLSVLLVLPSFAAEEHWAASHVQALGEVEGVESILTEENFNATVDAVTFEKLTGLIFGSEHARLPQAMTREAVVHEMAKIWADISGLDLETIPVIKMVIYPDTDQIDPAYNHSVTVAYMKDIAKGRASGIFDPKASVTYGEMAALLNNTLQAIAEESASEPLPIAAGRLETSARYAYNGEQVVFTIELMNQDEGEKNFTFSSGQQYEIIVENEADEEVYRYSDGRAFTMALIEEELAPGQSMRWQDSWDLTDKAGDRVPEGLYTAQIEVLARTEESDGPTGDQLTTTLTLGIYPLTEENTIEPETAERLIRDRAEETLAALSERNAEALSQIVHPERGVRFTPYTHVSTDSDVVMDRDQILSFFTDEATYLWGHFDGTGDPIRMTPGAYYERFIYSRDFQEADVIGYNEMISSGNMLENQFEVYPHAIIVEYYLEGDQEQYAGMDWRSLRLVFSPHEGQWYLVGVIHNQWTI